MRIEKVRGKVDIEIDINDCERKKHIQQVAYSTYHNALTQICFTCGVVRTELKEVEENE